MPVKFPGNCKDSRELTDRWRLVVNPYISGHGARLRIRPLRRVGTYLLLGTVLFPCSSLITDTAYGGAAYPSWMLGELPTPDEGGVERTAKFAGTSHIIKNRVKDCGEHYAYWLQPTPNANNVWSIDTDVCMHANPLAEEWRLEEHVLHVGE